MNSLPIEYFAVQNSNEIRFEDFVDFVDKRVRTWRDVEAMCLYCDLDDEKLSYMERHFVLPKSVLRMFKDKVQWSSCFVEYDRFDDAFVDEMEDYVDWASVILFSKKVTEECLKRHANRIPFNVLSSSRILSIGFMKEFKDRLDWEEITTLRINVNRLDDEFISTFSDAVDWKMISESGNLMTEQLEKYKERIDWRGISIWRRWTLDEMNRFFDLIDWKVIEKIGNFHLSNSVLNKMKSKVFVVS